MAPKPRMVPRKALQSVDSEQAKNSPSSKMPPPPLPKASRVLLQPELSALEASYRDIAIASGKLFQFYSHSKKERITAYSPYPPAWTARMLGRSVERYGQICDTIETRLQHSIAVIQRDINALKSRSKAEAEELTRKQIPTSTIPALLASPVDQPSTLVDSTSSNVLPPSTQTRRQSAILSSLHRPGLPLKLDLSSLGFHTDPSFATPVDVSVDLGLTRAPSPVTLAPKTAKASATESGLELFINSTHQNAPELSMGNENGAFITPSKLTVQIPDKDVIDLTSDSASRGQLGDSADKPIELDMDTNYDEMDLFGDHSPETDENGQQNDIVNNVPSPQNLDENLNKLLMAASKDPSMPSHKEPPSSQSGNDTSTDTLRPLEDNRRFNLTNVDFSALTGLFNAGNGVQIPQANASSDLDLMSQLLGMGGGNQTG